MSDRTVVDKNYIGDELQLFAQAQNWKTYWSSKIRPLLGQSVLEVGAGIGANLRLLKHRNQHWTAVEPDSIQATAIRQQCSERMQEVDVVTGTLLEISSEQKFDSIIYIDVLEHIKDHQLELLRALDHLKPAGRLIILSPAHQSLSSPFDQSVGHFRRYNKSSITEIKPEYCELEQLYYLDSVGFIASWLNAKILKSGMPTQSQVWLWDSIMVPLSKWLDRLTSYRIGKTIVMVLRKP